ncbi:chemotaxis response regulator protein-glutamate methylesterase CheB [Hydrogenimonas sp.]|nr:chemotaxis response regulator protein-glutamate methylesterase CheB [Hydrogenimonas sp.]
MAPEKLILIGASTGGPGLIETIVSSLPSGMGAAVVIAQHMDPLSLDSFAKRLGRISGLDSVSVAGRCRVSGGGLYILSDTAAIYRKGRDIYLETTEKAEGFYHPTIDTLFLSAAKMKEVPIYPFLLSGIGSDGAEGLLRLRESGCETVAQDEATSVVYGMPKAAAELGAASAVLSIEDIAQKIRSIA